MPTLTATGHWATFAFAPMITPGILLFLYCGMIVLVSIGGGRLPSMMRLTHLRTQLLMSGVGGLMLGIAMLHLLPHAAEVLSSPIQMGAGSLCGLVVMFLLVRLFHTHAHGFAETPNDPHHHDGCVHGHKPTGLSAASGQIRVSASENSDVGNRPPRFTWAAVFFGLVLHTLVDGLALAASVMVESGHQLFAGAATFIAIAAHKPLDAFAITSMMSRQKWSPAMQDAVNLSFSMACPVGAAIFYFAAGSVGEFDIVLGWGLAVSAGFFIGIALADLLPEVAFHDHDRGKLTAALLVGVFLAVAIELLPGHSHG